MKEKKVLAFDWDGTLIDSTGYGMRKIEAIFSEFNLEPPCRAELRRIWGIRVELLYHHISKYMLNDIISAEEFKDLYVSVIDDYPSMKEVTDVLARLKEFGYKLALITSRSHDSWLKTCQELQFDYKSFDFIQTATHYYHHKPSGRVFGPIINWAKRHRIRPDEIVYFGDTIKYDYLATQDSNPVLDFIGVASGVNTVSEFEAAGVPFGNIVGSYNEMPHFLNKLIQQRVEA